MRAATWPTRLFANLARNLIKTNSLRQILKALARDRWQALFSAFEIVYAKVRDLSLFLTNGAIKGRALALAEVFNRLAAVAARLACAAIHRIIELKITRLAIGFDEIAQA